MSVSPPLSWRRQGWARAMSFYYYPVLAGRRSSQPLVVAPSPLAWSYLYLEPLKAFRCTFIAHKEDPKVLGNDGCIFALDPRPDDVNIYARWVILSVIRRRSLKLAEKKTNHFASLLHMSFSFFFSSLAFQIGIMVSAVIFHCFWYNLSLNTTWLRCDPHFLEQ